MIFWILMFKDEKSNIYEGLLIFSLFFFKLPLLSQCIFWSNLIFEFQATKMRKSFVPLWISDLNWFVFFIRNTNPCNYLKQVTCKIIDVLGWLTLRPFINQFNTLRSYFISGNWLSYKCTCILHPRYCWIRFWRIMDCVHLA